MIDLILTDGSEIFEERQVEDLLEYEELRQKAREATDGNIYWTCKDRDQIVIAAGYDPRSLEEWEKSGIFDDVMDGNDVKDGLEERRYWRSAHGRQTEHDEAFESGRPMSWDDR